MPTTGDVSEGVVFVRNTVEFDDRDIRSASAARDEYGLPSILVYLTPEGLKKCNAVLTANVGKQLAIIVADKAISLPMIEGGPLTDDSVRISGNFSVSSVNALVKTLNKK